VKGINDQDIEAMIFFKKFYNKTLYPHCLLIITQCEKLSEDERIRLAENFFDNKKVKDNNIREMFGLGYAFMGCLDGDDFANGNETNIYQQYSNVIKMRELLIEKFIDKKNCF